MAIKKVQPFDPKDTKLAEFANALSHPARITILRTLVEQKRCVCGEIVDVLPLAQSTVSQHLKVLKMADLIHAEIEGTKSWYCINQDTLDEFAQSIQNLFSEFTQKGVVNP